MNFYFPDHRVLFVAENASHTLHNMLTLRGALVRDPRSGRATSTRRSRTSGARPRCCSRVTTGRRWGTERIVDFLAKQRDLYGYLHDQTLRLHQPGLHRHRDRRDVRAAAEPRSRPGTAAATTARSATTSRRSTSATWAGSTAIPPTSGSTRRSRPRSATSSSWAAPTPCSRRRARRSTAGDFRWVAQVVNHVVFADPENADARELQAAALEQLGYGAENGTWRNFFLMGAKELREGALGTPTSTAADDFVANLSLEQLFDSLAIRIDGPRGRKRADRRSTGPSTTRPTSRRSRTASSATSPASRTTAPTPRSPSTARRLTQVLLGALAGSDCGVRRAADRRRRSSPGASRR